MKPRSQAVAFPEFSKGGAFLSQLYKQLVLYIPHNTVTEMHMPNIDAGANIVVARSMEIIKCTKERTSPLWNGLCSFYGAPLYF